MSLSAPGSSNSRLDWPAAVRGQITAVTARLKDILAHNLVGVYLHGSLAMGCFNAARSDLDLLVVTRQRLHPDARRRLMETMLRESRRPAPIEISIVTLGQLHPWRHPAPYDFHFSDAWQARFIDALRTDAWLWSDDEERFDPDLAAHVTVIRARGVALHGDPILDVFPVVPVDDMRASVAVDLDEALKAIDANPIYAVLNCCRTLAYLREGIVLSKAEGGHWAIGRVPDEIVPLIRKTLGDYQHGGRNGHYIQAELDTFLAFAREALGPLLSQSQ